MFLLSRLGIRAKILAIVAMACCICGAISIGVAIHFKEKEFREGLVQKSRTLHSRIQVAADYVAGQGGLAPMIETFTNKYDRSSQLTDEDKATILKQVPIYAAMKVGENGSQEQNYTFRIFSDEPRNKDNMASPDELKILEEFRSNPKLDELVREDSKMVKVYKPIRLRESRGCLKCHSDPATSPWGDGNDILGRKMENWSDGRLHGVFTIINDIKKVKAANVQSASDFSTTRLVLSIILGSRRLSNEP